MELSGILSGPASSTAQNRNSVPTASPQPTTQRPTMAGIDPRASEDSRTYTAPAPYPNSQNTATRTPSSMPPLAASGSPTPKSVAFELLFSESSQYKARLPMRVQIYPHDTTDSIITSVKNFFGLYGTSGGAKAISFEDTNGNALIARYENIHNNMNVYVRVIDETDQIGLTQDRASHNSLPHILGASFPSMAPPHHAQALNHGQHISRPHSRTSRLRSVSPNSGRGRRSVSVTANPPTLKKSRSKNKSRNPSTHGSFADHSDGISGYSSGDGGAGSVSSKSRSEHIGNTEISLDNIVEGGRRKRAKFESSVSSADFDHERQAN